PLPEQIAALILRETPAIAALPAPPQAAACPVASVPPRAEPPGRVVTLAGPMDGVSVDARVDGPGAKARFANPGAISYDAAANVAYVADTESPALRRLRFDVAGGVMVDTLRSGVGVYEALLVVGTKLYASEPLEHRVVRFSLPDGAGPEVVTSSLGGPAGLALDPNGDLLVADYVAHKVLRVPLQGAGFTPLPFYGNGIAGEVDAAIATDARIDNPHGMVMAPDGKLYVVSFSQGQLHVVDTKSGRTSYLTGGKPPSEHPDGFWANANIDVPRAMAYDPGGRLILADGVSRLRAVSLHGDVQTLVGTLGPDLHPLKGFVDGPADQARLGFINGLAVRPDGSVLFVDGSNNAVRAWLPR
ncbi:MAG: repeat containing protein, partial [Cyanobacteria bacterium RYN_339]|nr:repeat containing protein [Cyanobacteria bacterium RYN_339]